MAGKVRVGHQTFKKELEKQREDDKNVAEESIEQKIKKIRESSRCRKVNNTAPPSRYL